MPSSNAANIIGTIFSFVSLVCLFLVNLSAPNIQSIYIMKFQYIPQWAYGDLKIVSGLYGYCEEAYNLLSECANNGIGSGFQTDPAGDVKFLLAMHPIGLIISFISTVVGLYACRHYSRSSQKEILTALAGPETKRAIF
ncbi:6066_t:CDS:2 [Ambispora leptoticha]|uniref:6066_t:CDS:1 n=1 Tax=Ambispora leptoticha TaxID=144679 RepID=A0A9N9GJC5_9GLOM|nr:6066_t:CDS:2 [Ambispora leptoticha]